MSPKIDTLKHIRHACSLRKTKFFLGGKKDSWSAKSTWGPKIIGDTNCETRVYYQRDVKRVESCSSPSATPVLVPPGNLGSGGYPDVIRKKY